MTDVVVTDKQSVIDLGNGSFIEVGIPDISPRLHNYLVETLLECEVFRTNSDRHALFCDKRIYSWANELPDATSPKMRVDSTVEYLHDKFNRSGENALVLLLKVLRDRTDSGMTLHQDLDKLVEELQNAPRRARSIPSITARGNEDMSQNKETKLEEQQSNTPDVKPAPENRKGFFERTEEFLSRSLRITKLLSNVKKSVDRLSTASNFKEIAASQIELLTSYYVLVYEQAHQSFVWATRAAIAGLIFFIAAITFLLTRQLQEVAIISLISGTLIEVISGIHFYLYNKSTLQLSEFHNRLNLTQHYLLADSMCDGLEGEFKQKARVDVVKAIVGIGIVAESQQREIQETSQISTG